MAYHNVIEVHYNWHTHPEHGCDWGSYRIGEDYVRAKGAYIRCEEIQIDFDEGMHAIIYFADGTTEYQWNLNKIIEAEKDVYDQVRDYRDFEETSSLSQPNSG